MSDDEKSKAEGSQQEEEEEVVETVTVKKEQLTAGLSRIQRTAGKSFENWYPFWLNLFILFW